MTTSNDRAFNEGMFDEENPPESGPDASGL